MEEFYFLVIGFSIGVLVTLKLIVPRMAKKNSAAVIEHPPAATSEVLPAYEAVATEEPLSAQLHRLSLPLEVYGDNTAHPKQLVDRQEFGEASALLANDSVALEIVTQYAFGANWTLACAALDALRMRDDREQAGPQVVSHFARLRPWPMYYALEFLLALEPRLPSGAPVAGAENWWNENLIIPAMFQNYFTKLEELDDVPSFGSWLQAQGASSPEETEKFLKNLNHRYANQLISVMRENQAERLDRGFLEGFGRFWSRSDPDNPMVEPVEWQELLDSAERAVTSTPVRSLLVRGEEKVGKSTFLRLLGDRLIGKGWSIFEAGGPELQAGQSYIGQLEERVRRLASEVVVSKRAIWYVPDIVQIAVSGTHSGQTASILDQVLGAMSTGRLLIISETTSAQLTQLVQLKPHLKGIFEAALLSPLSESRTRELVQTYTQRLTARSSIAFDADVVPMAMQLVRQYLDSTQLPGAVFDLVKLAYNHSVSLHLKNVTSRDVLASLSQLTGLPKSILDADEKVELSAVRLFFDQRVMGQGEAVQHVVDRIAMLKAGLTDPSKPIGVFLFAGPTGTGKTELAKTLADFLFGSAERLIRLDMSEYKTQDSISKIIGDAGSRQPGSDSLINRVRKQPFSVVLLDEFEKAHPNVWDLFLQVFDDGRLSDANGIAADFRHCIIILTSNLGATVHQNSGLGFGDRTEEFSPDQVMRAIAQSFRPEFVNRLDKVIVFQPLRRDLMREILHKELRLVLERRGFQNREWAVEWESSAIEFLLDKGFSAQLGARPLKRAIDQYLLAPLAATIVEHRVPEGDQFLFVRSDGRGIQVEFVDPDADRVSAIEAPQKEAVELAAIVLNALGSKAEHVTVLQELRLLGLRLDSEEWHSLSDRLGLAMGDANFWKDETRFGTLARFALLDRVKAAAKTAEALHERLEKSREKTGRFSPQLMARLARQLYLAKAGSLDALTNVPVESVLKVEIAMDAGGGTEGAKEWCDRLVGMYRGWADTRGMQCTTFPFESSLYLTISGFGAHRTLLQESGLHVLESGEEESGPSRCVARVRVAISPPGELKANAGRVLKSAIESEPVPQAIVRRYRDGSAPLVRDAKRGWRSGKLDAVLAGDFDLIGAVASEN